MKKNYSLKTWYSLAMTCFIMMFATTLKAQCIIGTGTATTNGTTADPIERYYNYEHFQTVYTAAELSAGGLTAGSSITAMGYSVSESAASLSNFTIDMGLTMQATANPYIAAGLTNVKTGFTYSPVVQAAGSFDMITFNTPFTWDGTSNIVVNTCTGSNPFTSPYGGLRYTTAPTGSTRYARQDVTSNCGAATATNTTNRPNIRFDFIAGSPCTGTPTAGTTAGPAGVCSGANFLLSLTGATTGVSGLTYQWQSSPDNVTYTNIAAATNATATVSQTAATYYQCIVTCTASGMSSTSTFLNVPMNSMFACYCSSMATNTADEEITNVTVGSLNNSSTCASVAPGPGSIATRYANYISGTGAPAAPSIARANITSASVTVGSCGTTNYTSGLAIFIDLNQNGSFADAGEKVYSNGATASINCVPATVVPTNFTIPITATLGLTAMRIINDEFSSGDAITSCTSYSYGETEDYLVNIIDLPAAPPTPTQSAAVPTCATGTDLSVAGAPSAGDAWYWQTSATGTSTATPVSGPYTVFVNGTYYVNTYNAANNFWSTTSSSITVTNIPLAPTPPAPIAAANPACLNTTISMPAVGSPVTYYWQGTTAGGTSTSLDASTPFSVTSSGTYYVAAYDASTSCWSTTNSLTVAIDTYVPPAPTTTASSVTVCQGSATAMISATAASAPATSIVSFGTTLLSPGTPVTFNATIPALPAGATITGTQLQVVGASAINGSWRSEIRVALSGAITLAATQLSTLNSGGLITPDPSITTSNPSLAGGAITLTLSESYDDGGVNDATFNEIRLVITYTTALSISWWDASSAGVSQGTGSPFETVGTTVLPNTSTPGTYTFYAQSISGACSSASRLPVSVVINPVLLAISPVNVTCMGAANGSFTLGTVTCGVAPFTYSVNASAFGVIPTNLAPGTYSVIAEDDNGDQSAAMSLVITEPNWSVPNSTAGPAVAVCQNATSAMVSVTPGVITTTIPFNVAGQPTEVNAAPGNIVATATLPSIPAGSVITSVSFSYPGIAATGGSWMSEVRLGFSGAVVNNAAAGTGATNAAGTFNYVRALPVGSVNLSGGAVNLLYWDSSNDNAGSEATFPTGASVATLTITYTLGGTINWYSASTGGSLLGTGTSLETVGTSVLPTTATPGAYDFYAESAYSGCTSPARTLVTVTVNALPTVTAASDATGAICQGAPLTLTGGGATGYVWDNGATNATAFPATSTTTYQVTGRDGNGCSNTATTTVTVNPAPAVTATSTASAVCAGNAVTLTSGGTALTYAWNNGVTEGLAFNPSATTTYIVTGTDGNSCTNTASVTVTVNALPIVTATSDTTGAVCAGTMVTLTGGGATSYAWDNSISNATAFATTTTTTYMVTGTDANSCTNTASIVVSVNALPAVTATSSATAAVCAGTMVTLTGGGATSYLWNNSVTDGVAFASTTTTTYQVTGTDANGCSNTASTTITVNQLPTVTAASDTSGLVCEGTMVTLAGGGATSYVWDNGVTDATAFATTSTTTYMVTGTDANSCTNTATVVVSVNPAPAVTAASDATGAVCEGTMVTLTSGGTALMYAWNNGVTEGMPFATTTTTTYMVTGTDGNSCTNTATVTVTVNALPAVTANATASAVCTGTMATLTGGGATSYVWDNSVTDGLAFTPAGTLTYNVIGTDGNGCTNTASTTITVNALPTVTATSDAGAAVCAGTMVTLSGGGTATSYAWDNGITNAVAFASTTTTAYTVIGTDANSCTNTAMVTVNVNPLPTVTMSLFTAPVCMQSSPMVLTGGSPTGGTYTGTGVVSGMFAPSVAGVGSFPITYTITDANSCSNSASSSVTVQDCTGINEGFASQEVTIFPNPTSGIINIAINNADYNELLIVVFNVQGKEVFSSVDTNVNGIYNKQINLDELSKGVYYIKLSADAEVKVQKLIIQ